jgi:2-phospho-L-lactate guanylyltransferase
MKLWLAVPAKPLSESKSRLSPALDAEARTALSRRLLTHVLRTAQASGMLAGTLVVSRDAAVRALAAQQGAIPLPEPVPDLNAALEAARAAALERGADALLVLPADLPLLAAEDIAHLHALVGRAPVVLVPSRTGGTNALALRPPGAIPFAFGEHSFAAHCALAAARGLAVEVWESPALALDVDLPADLVSLAAQQASP